jgi:hypothetical protein
VADFEVALIISHEVGCALEERDKNIMSLKVRWCAAALEQNDLPFLCVFLIISHEVGCALEERDKNIMSLKVRWCARQH